MPKKGKTLEEREKFRVVQLHIRRERARHGIRESELQNTPLSEFSCEMNGEGFSLVERQLVFTRDGFGEWRNLYGSVLELAYQYVVRGRRG